MDYEKLYKEALSRAIYYKEGITDRKLEEGENIMDYIFPELAESEDERIRKAVIECVKNYGPSSANPQLFKNMLAWLEKQGERKETDYNEELEKCKANPLYFFDKYVKAKFKEQNPTDKAMTMELFGNIYEEVEDNSSEFACSSCALFEICEVTKPNLPCVRLDGSLKRHFILVSGKSNA